MLKVCGHNNEAAMELAATIFLSDYNRIAISFVTKLNFWRRKLCKIQLDSLLSSS